MTGLVVRRAATSALTAGEVEAIRSLMWAAFADDEDGEFSEEDWTHSIGGTHLLLEVLGGIVAHASVVERTLEVDGRPLRTGYVEAVATRPGLEGRGYGSAVMAAAGDVIRDGFQLGALGTGRFTFYERLGWERWAGPSGVRTPGGLVATPNEDGWIMILRTPTTGDLRPSAPISCDWRPGDVW